METIKKSNFSSYINNIKKLHNNNVRGTEKNDRNIFIRDFLGKIGYDLEKILNDVSQKGMGVTKFPDIRIYENEDERNKNVQSQLVIETKSFGSLRESLENIDYLQLKRYIVLNISKIRLICVTDYINMYVFNVTNIKKQNKLVIRNLDKITKVEEGNIKNNLYFQINLLKIDDKSLNYIKKISYESVFQKLIFVNPQDYAESLNIANYCVRKNFIEELYYIVEDIHSDIRVIFNSKIDNFIKYILIESCEEDFWINIHNEINNEEYSNGILKAYILWGIRMNYLNENIFKKKNSSDIHILKAYFSNTEYRESFILTSIYNIINKTFFLRAIEDMSTENTKFIKAGHNNRYLSNGILNLKAKECKESLVEYLRDIYEFRKDDLKPYAFILKKDIYNWVITEVSVENLIKLIKVFNNVNFKKLNQDILGDIYEHYLENKKYEKGKSQRELLGQYYTPKPIVRFMWELTRDVLICTSNRDLYDTNLPMLDIIDISYGSGTFLCESILQINQIASNRRISNSGIVFSYMKDRNDLRKVEDHIFGFEINPLSNSIADINLFFSLIQLYGIDNNLLKKYPLKKLKLFRTNSYDINHIRDINSYSKELIYFDKELNDTVQESKDIIESKSKKYDIVIFNPPYGYIKPNSIMKNYLIPFAYPKYNYDKYGNIKEFSWNNIMKGKVPDNENNKGKLRDNYAFFFGVADKLLKRKGVMTFISSNSFISIPTYKWYRKYILENYKIHYYINFNNVSERSLSMFSPEASIATSIMILTKEKPNDEHRIKYLDCSDNTSILEKYRIFLNITKYNSEIDNKNSIEEFNIKSLKEIKFVEHEQKKFLENEGYTLHIKNFSNLVNKNKFKKISSYGNMNSGVGPGDVKVFVNKNKEKLRSNIEDIIFSENLDKLNATAKEYIKSNLANNKIIKTYDENKCIKFVFQKNMKRYYYEDYHYIYHDRTILWRSRLKKKKNNEINEKYKLFLREMREKREIYSLVTDELIIPQDGGRFNYLICNEKLTVKEMYVLVALINSNVGQKIYKELGVGVKDIEVPDLEYMSNEIKEKLYLLSLELHEIYSDYNKLKNKCYIFKSKYFENNIKSKAFNYDLSSNSPYWNIKYSNVLFVDYYVSESKLYNEIILLNSNITIEMVSKEYAEKVYSKYLKDYNGDIRINNIVINDFDMLDEKEIFEIEKKIKNQINKLEDKINNIASKIYSNSLIE